MSTEKNRYAVLAPLKVGDKRIDPVEGKVVTVELTDEEAEELKALGVVGDAPVKPAAQNKPEKSSTQTKPEKPDEKGDASGGGDGSGGNAAA